MNSKGAMYGGAAALGLVMAIVMGIVILGGGSPANALAPDLRPSTVPKQFEQWVLKAGALCPDTVGPAAIAAQIEAESNWNPTASSPVGAQGIAQFMPGTWPQWGRDDDGTGNVTPFNPADAIMAQGRYMCSLADTVHGYIQSHRAQGDVLDLALAAYNAGPGGVLQAGGVPHNGETDTYVSRIRSLMAKYAAATIGDQPSGTTGAVIAAAQRWVGTMYSWGGGSVSGPTNGMPPDAGVAGFDCSSLVQYAYYQGTGGKLTLPRVAGAQYEATSRHRVSGSGLAPGDLLFYGDSPGSIHHVTMYVGGGRMIEAPQSGERIHITPVRVGGDFFAATRVL